MLGRCDLLFFLVPNYDMIEKKAGSLIRTFKDLAFPQGFSKKRGAGDRATGASAKRAKEEGVEVKWNGR